MKKLKSFFHFLKDTKAELKKVKWYTWKEVWKETGIVLVFVLISMIFFFGVDTVIAKVADWL